ncbi:MAG: response regulator [Kofleriaceae bacterium]|nr:response regulator [Kofleriaceae bacterium]
MRLLVADDDPEMRSWLKLALRPLAATLVDVADGVDLLDHLSIDGAFDAVITDVRMPGPDGLKVVAMARTAGLHTPILVITAFPDPSVRTLVARMPRTALLAKPFELDELRAALRDLVAGAA